MIDEQHERLSERNSVSKGIKWKEYRSSNLERDIFQICQQACTPSQQIVLLDKLVLYFLDKRIAC